jgi:predicted  nucleic acid-binding Zn-ribbon protein
MADQNDYTGQALSEITSKMRDIEEKQRVSKDRLMLIGQNLVEIKESASKKILDIKKDVEIMKQEIERLSSFLETVSSEFSKFAKKEDLEILAKQAKMFQPLKLMGKKDLERLKNI